MSKFKTKLLTTLGGILCLIHPHGAMATDVPDVNMWHNDLTKPVVMQAVEEAEASPAPTPIGAQIAEAAKRYIGVPYVWGGTSPSGFDCSGLMQYVYAQFGITISRTTHDQIHNGWAVARDELKEGDLILFGHPEHHVGMYVGDGNFIEAPYSGAYVRIVPLSSRSDYNCARRIVE